MVVALSIVGTLCILWGLVHGFFSVLGDDMGQVIASAVFVIVGIVCICIAIFGY